MRSSLLMIGFCGTWLAACGDGGGGGADGGSSGGAPTFEEMCDRGVTRLCEQINKCGTSYPMDTCVAKLKAANCGGGIAQYCGAGATYQPSKGSACLDAVNAAGCELLDDMPPACAPSVVCSSSPGGGGTPASTPGEACQALGDPGTCDAKATICYAAGTGSSCPDRALCVGNASGMTCAARCTTDADCASAGLVCVQGCAMTILNGFCVTPKLNETFVQSTCTHGNAGGLTGWTR